MKRTAFAIVIASLSAIAMAGGNHHQQPPKQPENYNDASALGVGIAGAAALSGSSLNADIKANSSSDSSANGIGIGGAADAVSGSSSVSESGDSTSSADSSSDNSVNIDASHSSYRKYPDIPVNAGVTFAQVCQEGSSSTGMKVSIALTTDSVICTQLKLADAYFTVMSSYAQACSDDILEQQKDYREKSLRNSMLKGKEPLAKFEAVKTFNCLQADVYEEGMIRALSQAEDAASKTHGTGILAKWATQIGIPVSLISVILMAL